MAKVAVPRELTSPNLAIPVTSKSCFGWSVEIWIVSPTCVVLPVRRAGVDHYLAVPLGPRALDEVERVEAVDLGAGLDAEAEAGCALGIDRLAVGADDLRVGLVRDRAGRGLDVRERGDLIDHRLVDGRGLRLDALEADFGALPRDDDVGPRIGLVEDGRERLVDRVREDVGAAHHRDPEDDRERGERSPELAAEQSSESDADHASTRTAAPGAG